ncbi:hypothetical protein CIHG_00451 [Coccidioides immitis H538.4]|uniref:Uncharacterized protein n=1 Tax=Coccidioides immitis H538.4 TaxID=396776 RepID=A0A0J8RBV4_COCIT|nr:hypothetical protein CIHG_00451 [Coccidioides immitis H538.4]
METLTQLANQFYVRELVGILLFASTTSWVINTLLRIFGARSIKRPRTPDLEKPSIQAQRTKQIDRKQGEWIPQDFKRPDPVAYPNWDVHTSQPKPYRPFRYGPKYFITMGLRSMKWDEWIELDNHYPRYHADKARRIKEREKKMRHGRS